MTDLSFHLAPNAPWIALVLAALLAVALGRWAYRFAVPPLPAAARAWLPALRVIALVLLLALLAQPVLERAAGGRARIVVLLDRSRSMDLPESPGGAPRAVAAQRAVEALTRSLGGGRTVEVRRFASKLEPDSARDERVPRGATALGDALDQLAASPDGANAGSVIVVSDGVVNAGTDPVAAARALGIPVHAVLVGRPSGADRSVAGVEASPTARVGQPTPVRVRVVSSEPRGTAIPLRIMDGTRELAHGTAIAPGGGAEAEVELSVMPDRPGLAVWTASVDSLRGETTLANNAHQVATEVAPGRLGVLIVSAGLNWDLTFLRRALAGDSSLAVSTRVREREGWRTLERTARDAARTGAPAASDLRAAAVVVLDAISPSAVSPDFDRALSDFVRRGGGLLVLGGQPPGLRRFAAGWLGRELTLAPAPGAFASSAGPEPTEEAREITEWDSDPVRGARAWHDAAPLSDLMAIGASAGDRVVLAAAGHGPPLALARRIGRGQALLVNGTGLWRWSLSPLDDLAAERARVLWRRWMRWLAEPVQGEALRVRPDRWLSASGEPVRLQATLQDAEFHPVAGAEVAGEVVREGGDAGSAANRTARPIRFESRGTGSHEVTLEDLPAGRWRARIRATKDGHELARAETEFAVDRWSLEEAHTDPDSASLAAVASATGGRITNAASAGAWARGLPAKSLARGRTESVRLWESPWLFVIVVAALSLEWAWRRRRGLP